MIDGERMTAGQVWELYVGEQTPAEFMACEQRGVNHAVRRYMASDLCGWFASLDRESRDRCELAMGRYIEASQRTPGDDPQPR